MWFAFHAVRVAPNARRSSLTAGGGTGAAGEVLTGAGAAADGDGDGKSVGLASGDAIGDGVLSATDGRLAVVLGGLPTTVPRRARATIEEPMTVRTFVLRARPDHWVPSSAVALRVGDSATGSQNTQPSGAGGQAASGSHVLGITQPCGAAGQFGGGFQRYPGPGLFTQTLLSISSRGVPCGCGHHNYPSCVASSRFPKVPDDKPLIDARPATRDGRDVLRIRN